MEIAHKLPTSTHKSENCQSLAEHESMAGLVSKETVEWKGGGGGGGEGLLRENLVLSTELIM